MKTIVSVFLLSMVAVPVIASSFEEVLPSLPKLEVLRDALRGSFQDAQFDNLCSEILDLLAGTGCTCSLKPLQNELILDCNNLCVGCSTVYDWCADISFTIVGTLIPFLEPKYDIVTEVQSGEDSSQSTLSITSKYGEDVEMPESCSTHINGNPCTSCVPSNACLGSVHDCTNLGLQEPVDTCDEEQLLELPTTNPFSTIAYQNATLECGVLSSLPSSSPVGPDDPTAEPTPAPSSLFGPVCGFDLGIL